MTQRKKNLFGWSAAEKTKARAKRKHVSAGVTEARSAGYKLGRDKSDEYFAEWLERKDLADEKDAVKGRLAKAFNEGFEKGQAEIKPKYSPYPMHVWDHEGYRVYAEDAKTWTTDFDGRKRRFHKAIDVDKFIEGGGKKKKNPLIRIVRVKL